MKAALPLLLAPLIVFAQPAAPSLFGLDEKALTERWGKGTVVNPLPPADKILSFTVDGVEISAAFVGGRCEMLLFQKKDGALPEASVAQILERTGGGWTRMDGGWKRADGAFASEFSGSLTVASAGWVKALKAYEAARESSTIKGL
jgi:hypothetical protein